MSEKLTRILSDTLGINAAEISQDTAMATTPVWDSVMHLNVCMSLEAEFGVSLTPEEMIEMTSVAVIETVLRKHGVA